MEKNIFEGIDGLIGKSYSAIGEDVIILNIVIKLEKKYI
jgi:hypothetical protein